MHKQKKLFKPTFQTTIAEFNKVSIKTKRYEQKIDQVAQKPLRIILPQYFNIPPFQDPELHFSQNGLLEEKSDQTSTLVGLQHKSKMQQDPVFRKRIKDLTILAEGMKRAKNKKEQSRYYFTLGVVMHNGQQYQKAIHYFQEFLKLVLQLGDQKSLQLALNSLGCEYMYIGDLEKAKQFHRKQTEISSMSDRFISTANSGICEQMNGAYQIAYSNYQKLREEDNEEAQENQFRIKIADKLIQRIEQKILKEQVFMTENFSPSSPTKSPRKFEPISNSPKNKKSEKLTKKQSTKILHAISLAQQSMEQHLMSSSMHFSPRKTLVDKF